MKMKYVTTLLALSYESAPWTAFLVLSVPKFARMELGAFILATSVLVGPAQKLHQILKYNIRSDR